MSRQLVKLTILISFTAIMVYSGTSQQVKFEPHTYFASSSQSTPNPQSYFDGSVITCQLMVGALEPLGPLFDKYCFALYNRLTSISLTYGYTYNPTWNWCDVSQTKIYIAWYKSAVWCQAVIDGSHLTPITYSSWWE